MTTNASIAFSSQITHIGSGASLIPTALSVSGDISTALVGSGNLARYDRCDAALMIAPTASIALASTQILLFRRDLNIDSTNDEPLPGTSNERKLVGSFNASATTTVSTTQYLQCCDVPLSGGDCEFYIKNNLGVNIPAGWTLKITPKTDSFA